MNIKNSVRKRRSSVYFVSSSTLVLSALMMVLLYTGLLEIVERPLLDVRYRMFNQNNIVSDQLVFLTVDEDSLEELNKQIGGWPWPRGTVVAQLIVDYVMSGNPGAFLFDIMYSEYSPTEPGGELPTSEDWDLVESALFWTQQSYPVFFTDAVSAGEAEPRPMFDAAQHSFALSLDYDDGSISPLLYQGYLAPFDPLREFAPNLHAVNYISDPDGVVRRYPLLIAHGNDLYPSLALRGLIMMWEPDEIGIRNNLLELKKGGEFLRRIPMDDLGRLRVNFYRHNRDFEFISASDVIRSAQQAAGGEIPPLIPAGEMQDRAVIFGAQALALMDVLDMPVETDAPGPLLHVQVLSELLEGHSLIFVPDTINSILSILLVFLALAGTVYIPGRIMKTITVPLLTSFGVISALLLFRHAGIVVHMTALFGTSLTAYLCGIAYVAMSEGKERSRITSAMGKYLAPAVMSEVLDRYDELVGEVGETRDVAVLFSDVRGFTTVSEQFPAETVVYVLNKYLGPMIDIVFQHQGTLDKMIGDAIMAFWGAPRPDENKDVAAINAALHMIRELDSVNQDLAAEQLPQLRIGIGINTGPMIVGNIGSEKRLDYTAIGDNVNLGSRIEGLTKYYRSPVLVSQSTRDQAGDEFVFLPVDTVAVKGKSQGIGIYRPLCTADDPMNGYFRELVHAFSRAQSQYRAGEFEAAYTSFSTVAARYPETTDLAAMFLERIDRLKQDRPAENWDGVWVMEEK